ncbi:MAG: CDP-diacylglycerol--glycerol-3-phosphate 3-phosphatidyltransferase [Micropruina sp.]|nr:CDP-diacylglycerol--glycerol-3-phosphate 3-phosphatidyltransferase [Micropruina sp.]
MTTAPPSRLNPANALTVLRLVLVPVFAWMLLSHPHEVWWRLATTLVFGLAIATDAVDGRIARKYNLITDFGKLWDSIADKTLTGMAFIGLSILGELPWWVTALVLAREWGITWMRVAMLKYGVMAANAGGKLKTVLQSIALLLYLPGLPMMPVWLQWIAHLVMAAAVLLTLVTAVPYIREALTLRRAGRAEQEK